MRQLWTVDRLSIKMTEGDYGISLPIEILGADMSAEDSIRFQIKAAENGTSLVDKVFSPVEENTILLVLTEAESRSLSVGHYYYVLDWYKNEQFMCNIVERGIFRVGDKA